MVDRSDSLDKHVVWDTIRHTPPGSEVTACYTLDGQSTYGRIRVIEPLAPRALLAPHDPNAEPLLIAEISGQRIEVPYKNIKVWEPITS